MSDEEPPPNKPHIEVLAELAAVAYIRIRNDIADGKRDKEKKGASLTKALDEQCILKPDEMNQTRIQVRKILKDPESLIIVVAKVHRKERVERDVRLKQKALRDKAMKNHSEQINLKL